MIKNFIIIGAAIGAIIGVTFCIWIKIMLIGLAFVGFEGNLLEESAIMCIITATCASVGSLAGLIVGIAVSVFSRNNK